MRADSRALAAHPERTSAPLQGAEQAPATSDRASPRLVPGGASAQLPAPATAQRTAPSEDARLAAPSAERGSLPNLPDARAAAGERSRAQAQANAQWAATLLDALAAQGLREVVASPGARSTPLILAARAHPLLRLRLLTDERVAGFVALGLARGSGRPVGLIATSGSAGAHWLPALIEARQSGIGLLALTANRPFELSACGAPQAVPQGHFFTDQVGLAEALPAPGPELDSFQLRALETLAARVWRTATGPEATPVHLDLAFREPLWLPGVSLALDAARQPSAAAAAPAPAGARSAPPRFASSERVLSESALQTLANQLRAHPRGLVVCGPDAAGPSPRAAQELGPVLRALADALGWPLVCDAASGIRTGAEIAAGEALARARGADAAWLPSAVLRFGRPPVHKGLASLVARASVQWTLDPGGRTLDPSHSAQTYLAVDALPCARALLARLKRLGEFTRSELQAETGQATPGLEQPGRPMAHPPRGAAGVLGGLGPSEDRGESAASDPRASTWARRWRTGEAAARAALADATAQESLWGGGVAATLAGALPPGALVHVASSMAIRDLDAFWSGSPLRISSSRGANGIDGTIATACGLALADAAERAERAAQRADQPAESERASDRAEHAERAKHAEGAGEHEPVTVLCGDLAFLHDLGGLAAARGLGVSLRIVVTDNRGGGIFSYLPVAAHEDAFEDCFLTPPVADLGALAAACGAEHRRVTSRAELLAALAAPAPPLLVIQAEVERARCEALHADAWRAVQRALDALPSQLVPREEGS